MIDLVMNGVFFTLGFLAVIIPAGVVMLTVWDVMSAAWSSRKDAGGL